VKDAGRYKPEDKLPITYSDSMAGIMAALITSDDVEMWSKDINDLPLAFVAPLSACYDNILHFDL